MSVFVCCLFVCLCACVCPQKGEGERECGEMVCGAASLARGAESEEEWSAWGIVKKEKHKGRESMENGLYAGKRQVVGGATEVGMRGGGWADGGRADGGQTR